MRYFRKHPYDKAEHLLISFTTDYQDVLRIVATQVLSAYQSEQVVQTLRNALSDSNWHVKQNASESLVVMEVSATMVDDIITSDDQFVKEIFSYHFNKEKSVNA